MKLLLRRTARRETYTIGKLFVDDAYFCDTCEDRDRGLTSAMTETEIAKVKVKDETAIPTGTYKVRMDEVSNRFGKQDFYVRNANGGRLPRLENVKGYRGVLIHVGNTDKDTSGCILVGRNTVVGKVTESKATFLRLYPILRSDPDNITITIE